MGLFALEDIPAGNFIIEYIGEVLEEEEYLRRKDFYALVGVRATPRRCTFGHLLVESCGNVYFRIALLCTGCHASLAIASK
eukprot:1158973-Pelagomonas_calceolata.AAC.18